MTRRDLPLRAMRDDEQAAVIALWERCGLTRPWNDPQRDIAFARASENADVLVGEIDGALAAAVMVGHDGHRGAAYYVAIAPEHQSAGWGRALMRAAEAWCRSRGVWKMNLLVRDDNAAAIAFYERLGYAPGATTQLGKVIDPLDAAG
ncbi:MAG: GNAT family acetyltransferase [Pseudomonadota bacterium]